MGKGDTDYKVDLSSTQNCTITLRTQKLILVNIGRTAETAVNLLSSAALIDGTMNDSSLQKPVRRGTKAQCQKSQVGWGAKTKTKSMLSNLNPKEHLQDILETKEEQRNDSSKNKLSVYLCSTMQIRTESITKK